MPAPTAFFPSLGYPALYLYPIDDSFAPKHISLAGGQRVKIGRQTNAKTIPGERNGYFDSKVLSRQHAEVWEESGKICIRDVKSSNGTFINGERLSPEGLESEPYDLKTDDIVEFGIDIVGEDNKTIVHHKVAARVVCVLTEQDAQTAARAEQSHAASTMHVMSGHGGPSNGNSFNFNAQGGSAPRRPAIQQQGLTGMGGMGGSMRPPGKSGLTFDHILSRLQGELQKSRDTGAELHNLTGAMNEIHDTIGGALPQNLPAYPQTLPPVRSLPAPEEQQQAPAPALTELRSQLHDTQSSLATHVDKMRALEGVFAEHEVIKREVTVIRDMMEEWKREVMENVRSSNAPHSSHVRYDDSGDDDDARSIATIVPHELERVEEEDEEQLVAEEEDDEERRRRREELGRPRTPEPTGMGMRDNDYGPHRAGKHTRRRSPSPSVQDNSLPSSVVEELSLRITTLSEQLQTALSLSSALQEQHTAAQSTISALESKVISLESAVQSSQSSIQSQQEAIISIKASQSELVSTPPPAENPPERESLTAMLNDWKKGVEGQWSCVQEEWSQERERLSKAREEWENKVKVIEIGLGNTVAKVDAGLASIANQAEKSRYLPNGLSDALVAPPSPRSLSSDSNRPRHRRRRSSSSRGRHRSRSAEGENNKEEDTTASESADSVDLTHSSSTSITSVSSHDAESKLQDAGKIHASQGDSRDTPTSWVMQQRLKTQPGAVTYNGGDISNPQKFMNIAHSITVQTAIGVLVLSVAAAAVAWRVKPE